MAEAGRDGLLKPRSLSEYLQLEKKQYSVHGGSHRRLGPSGTDPIRGSLQTPLDFSVFLLRVVFMRQPTSWLSGFSSPRPARRLRHGHANHVHYIAILDDQRVWAQQKLAVAFTTAATFSTCKGAERRVSGSMHETGGRCG
jgi:hypothetical protein